MKRIVLKSVTRDADGVVHCPGESAELVREENNLHRVLLYVRFNGKTTILFPHEVEVLND